MSVSSSGRRWGTLAVLGVAQLMVVLDATIVNVALPSAQSALGFSDDNRQWIVTAYALAFGSLLPLGGRLSDLFGRRWAFLAGLLGFAGASAVGGAAQSFGVLVAARGLQGVFAALLAPAALALLTSTFTEPSERNRAFAIFGGIGGAGAAVGLLLGGVLTDALSWRWSMYVNLAFALPALAAAFVLLTERRAAERPALDLPGAVTASLGLFAIVFGFSRAETGGWGALATVAPLAAGVVLLLVFVAVERRAAHPLVPLRIVTDRTRGASLLLLALASIGIYGVFLFLTFYLQLELRFSAVETGLAFLPLALPLTVVAAVAQTRVLPRTGPRPLLVGGMAVAAAGMAALAQLDAGSTYVGGVLPGLVLLSVGLGAGLATAINSATHGIEPEDSGAAGALVNTSQQVGSAIGLALLSTVAAGAAGLSGYTTAFWWAGGFFAVAAVVSGLLMRRGVLETGPGAEPVFTH